MDAVIDLVRNSPDAAASRSVLMSSETSETNKLAMGLSREQADAVLRLQLGQMNKLKQNELKEEREELESTRKSYQKLLDEDDAVYKVMENELEEMDKKYGKERKSKILLSVDEEVDEVEMVKNSRSGEFIRFISQVMLRTICMMLFMPNIISLFLHSKSLWLRALDISSEWN